MGTQHDRTAKDDPLHQGTAQVGTHGNEQAGDAATPPKREQDRGVDDETRQMRQGDRTDPPMPSGTTPLERDQRPINQQR